MEGLRLRSLARDGDLRLAKILGILAAGTAKLRMLKLLSCNCFAFPSCILSILLRNKILNLENWPMFVFAHDG